MAITNSRLSRPGTTRLEATGQCSYPTNTPDAPSEAFCTWSDVKPPRPGPPASATAIQSKSKKELQLIRKEVEGLIAESKVAAMRLQSTRHPRTKFTFADREQFKRKIRAGYDTLVEVMNRGLDDTPPDYSAVQNVKDRLRMAGALGSRAGAAVTVGLVGTSVCTAAAVATIPMAMIALPVAIHPCMDLSPARIAAAPLVAAYRTTFGVKPDTNPLLITSNYRKYGFLGPKLFKRLDQLPKARFAAARRQMSTYAVAQRGEKYLYQVLQGNSFCLTPPHFIPRPQPTPVTIQPERPQLTDWPFPLPEQPRSNAIAPTISTAPVQPMPSRIEAAQVAQRGTIQRAPVRLPVAQRRQPETLDHSPLQASRSEPAMGTTTYPPPPASWQFPETEEFAEAFNRFQSRLAWTAEYRTPQTHTMMVARVDKLISAMRKSPTLRGLCFVIADNSLRHCGDRVALGLNEMELAHIDVQAASGKFTTEELFLLAEGFFKVHTLDKIALAKIGRLRNAGFEVDEVEIHLTYSQKLAGVLQLPGVTRNILFGSHHVTAEDLAEAEGLVRQGLDQSASVDFIAKWTPWQNAMERLHPEAYELVRQLQTVERDALSIKPFRTSEHEWMESFKTLEKREASLIHDVTTRLTRKFLEGRESNHH